MALTRSGEPCPVEEGMAKWWFVQVDDWSLHRVKPRRFMPKGTSFFRVGLDDLVYHLTSEWWVGIHLVGISYRGALRRERGDRYIMVRRPIVKQKTAAAAAGDGAKHVAAMETTLLRDLMPIIEHCALVRYDDGQVRLPGWVTIKTLGAAWIVQVKDPDSANSFQFVAETIDRALEGAALLLACDDAPWQPDAFLKKKK